MVPEALACEACRVKAAGLFFLILYFVRALGYNAGAKEGRAMSRLFTQLRCRTDACGTPESRLTLRIGLNAASLLVLGAVTFIGGCAKPYGTVLRHYESAPVCCASLTELPVEPLKLGDKKSFDLGGGSPAYRFETGKSYFRAFALPQGPYPYRVTVSSYLVGDNLK
jgi:hypothetical protein